jgi:hypothetical protein
MKVIKVFVHAYGERNCSNLNTHKFCCNEIAGICMIMLLMGAFQSHWDYCQI